MITIADLLSSGRFEILNKGKNTDTAISVPYCCDLLSFAMGRAPERSAWCTVMSNINTVAVASLTEVGCVILCEGAEADRKMLEKAKLEKLTLLKTNDPVFETALWIYQKINETA